MLAYADIKLICQFYGFDLTDTKISSIIFPDTEECLEKDFDRVEKIRKTTKPLYNGLFVDRAIYRALLAFTNKRPVIG